MGYSGKSFELIFDGISWDLRGCNGDKNIIMYITNPTYLGVSEDGVCPQMAVEIRTPLLMFFFWPHIF